MKQYITALSLFAVGLSAHAANINWGSAMNVTAATDISTNGSLINAYNYGTLTSYTINGVNFVGTTSGWGTNVFTGYVAHTVGGNYGAALSTGNYQTGVGSSYTQTLSGLTIGYTYEVQIWLNDLRDGTPDTMLVDSGASTPSVTLTTDTDGGIGGTDLSQYTLGTFTADATTQTIRYTATGGGGGATINMFQLRQTAVPEPGTYGLLGAGALALAAAVRRRRR